MISRSETIDNYLISVIIPHYNCPQKLSRLISSIYNNDMIQIIVVDDQSSLFTEQYAELVEKFKDKVEFYYNDVHCRSAGRCRNIAIKKAKGKWLLFADSDDYFIEDAYELLLKYANNYFEYDIVFFPPDCEDKNNNRVLFYQRLIWSYAKSNIGELRIRYLWDAPWSKLIKKEIVTKNNIKFDETKVANDVMFSCKVGNVAKKICVVYDKLYVITENGGSLTNKKSAENWMSRIDVLIKKNNYLLCKLSESDYKALHINGRNMLIMTLTKGYGFKMFISILQKLYANRIRIL